MTVSGAGVSLLEHFSALKDPRQVAKVLFPLPDILFRVLAATLASADDFVEAQTWGEERPWLLRRFVPYADGVPSHDTLNNIVNTLDSALFKRCLVTWVETLRTNELEFVAIDGKTSRRSHARAKGRQRFLPSEGQIHNIFQLRRLRLTAAGHRTARDRAFQILRDVTGAALVAWQGPTTATSV